MKTIKYWLIAVIFDLLLAAAFYAWQGLGIEGAGRVVVFFLWFTASIRVIGAIAVSMEDDKEGGKAKDLPARPAGFGWYHGFTESAVVLAMVWVGYVALPIAYLISSFVVEGRRQRQAKPAEEAEALEEVEEVEA